MLSNTGLTRMYAFRRGDCHIDGSHCTVVIGCCVGYSHLTTVDVSHNQITDLTHLPKSVRYLDASYNLLTSMAHIDRLTNLICLRLAHAAEEHFFRAESRDGVSTGYDGHNDCCWGCDWIVALLGYEEQAPQGFCHPTRCNLSDCVCSVFGSEPGTSRDHTARADSV